MQTWTFDEGLNWLGLTLVEVEILWNCATGWANVDGDFMICAGHWPRRPVVNKCPL